MSYNNEKIGAFIVPTGIGAAIGGFAGDAGAYARKFANKCKLIVNPNVVNAACFSAINDNMLYVEGFALDKFFKGDCNLVPSTNNKIGIVFDKQISQNILNIHINTINAVKTVYGINIIGYEITEDNVGVDFSIEASGISAGNVKNIAVIKTAAEKLINKGAEAIAIVCSFPDDENEDYANGIGVDPVGGVEAIISHYMSKELNIPCAHAPAFEKYDITTNIVDQRCAAEYITPTFLPCILIGLNNAPKFSDTEGINIKDLDFLIMPYNSLGGIPVLEMNKLGKNIYGVKENNTVLNVTHDKINCNCKIYETYDELLEII